MLAKMQAVEKIASMDRLSSNRGKRRAELKGWGSRETRGGKAHCVGRPKQSRLRIKEGRAEGDVCISNCIERFWVRVRACNHGSGRRTCKQRKTNERCTQGAVLLFRRAGVFRRAGAYNTFGGTLLRDTIIR